MHPFKKIVKFVLTSKKALEILSVDLNFLNSGRQRGSNDLKKYFIPFYTAQIKIEYSGIDVSFILFLLRHCNL